MELLGYAAVGGLERVAIVAGAVIIGYWGYRLYNNEKQVGLVFMGLAVMVLVGALATGSNYVKSVGEGYQLASASAAPSTPAEPVAHTPAATAKTPAATAKTSADPISASADESSPFLDQQPSQPDAVAPVVAAPETAGASKAATPEAAGALEAAGAPTPPAMPAEFDTPVDGPADTPVRLATGQELGGRIMSVKSENVSLEWSSDSD
jgi:hypothetical protein